jgi:transcriptional regulator GlxA family with amidase domain
MRTRARRVVVLTFDEVELLDVTAPLVVLTAAGRGWNFRPFRIEVAAAVPGKIQTRNQVALDAPLALGSIDSADILWIPGGYGARRLFEDSALGAELARLGERAEIIAGVGWGVALLARAGLVGAVPFAATSDVAQAILGVLPNARVESHSAVHAAERVKTARASGAAIELALALVTSTLGPKVTAMIINELELPPAFAPTRIELKY